MEQYDNEKYHIIFDTETTGLLPKKNFRVIHPKRFDKWKQCRIVQIAWLVCNDEGDVVRSHDYIIKPDGFTVPEESFKIHGISHENAVKNGQPIVEILKKFLLDVTISSTIVAHNVVFDVSVVLSEMFRSTGDGSFDLSEVDSFYKKNSYCTMLHGTKKGGRWPKLDILYKEYFNCAPDLTLHNALNDAEICRKIYFYQKNTLKTVF
jgi:DNA polymerase III epsilon subunit-like protein